ncbi:hypothetical protein [Cytobacillus gottheilii]|uniref:hypothetical protein n=1 Tax=Cytobacillus gottheilii TaxID=859144 RepID=UPI0024940D9A|nr:hypothetical protein [Cytobacillus gottheilii]
MLELGNYTDEDLASAINISINTLKNKRKVTEQRNLKDYNWSRNKKNKVYTIHSYKDLERNSLTDTFEALVADYSKAEIPLGNSYKALVIFLIIYKIDDNFIEMLI